MDSFLDLQRPRMPVLLGSLWSRQSLILALEREASFF